MKNNKLVALLGVLIVGAAVLVGTKYANNSEKSPTSVVVKNHTITGNLIKDLDAKEEYVSSDKKVTRYNTNGREVYLNSAVTYNSTQKIIEELKALEAKSHAPIFLLIDSPGGSVYDGNLVISQMEASKAPIYTVCMRLCASMAAYIHSYCHKRLSVDRSTLMYHPASGGIGGQVPNMVSMLASVTRTINKLNANIVSRSKLSRQDFEAKVAYEIWIDAEDALEQGLTDEIVSVTTSWKAEEEQASVYEEKTTVAPPTARRFNFDLISPYAKELW